MERLDKSKTAHGCGKKCAFTGLLVIIVLVLVSLVILVPVLYMTLANKDTDQFGVIFAAETDHTDMFVYRWDGQKRLDHTVYDISVAASDTGLVELIHKCTTSPGLGSFVSDPALAGNSLAQCLEQAVCKNGSRNCVPTSRRKLCRVYLGGTDELRLVNDRDHIATRFILDSASAAIRDLFPFHARSQVLSHKEESIANFVAINNIVGSIPPASLPAAVSGTIGLEELSFLLTFVPDTTNLKHTTQLSLYGTNYSLYTHHDVCYGWQEAWRVMAANLSLIHEDVVPHPCLPLGYQWNISTAELFSIPCTNWDHDNRTEVVRFKGTADSTSCSESIEDVLLTSLSSLEYGVMGSYICTSQLLGQVIYQFFDTAMVSSQEGGWDKVEELVHTFCNLSWEQIKIRYPSADRDNLARMCFYGTFVVSLLQSYGFNESAHGDWNIDFRWYLEYQQQSNHESWARGLMVEKTRKIPVVITEDHPFTDTILVILLLVLTVIVILFFVCLVCSLKTWCGGIYRYTKQGYIQV